MKYQVSKSYDWQLLTKNLEFCFNLFHYFSFSQKIYICFEYKIIVVKAAIFYDIFIKIIFRNRLIDVSKF